MQTCGLYMTHIATHLRNCTASIWISVSILHHYNGITIPHNIHIFEIFIHTEITAGFTCWYLSDRQLDLVLVYSGYSRQRNIKLEDFFFRLVTQNYNIHYVHCSVIFRHEHQHSICIIKLRLYAWSAHSVVKINIFNPLDQLAAICKKLYWPVQIITDQLRLQYTVLSIWRYFWGGGLTTTQSTVKPCFI